MVEFIVRVSWQFFKLVNGGNWEASGSLPEFQGSVHCHPVQPSPNACTADGSCLLNQDEECCLESILGI
jgi:hypothetical protein